MDIINLTNINLTLGKKNVFTNFNMTFSNNRTYSILGPYGCGKTSLLKIISDQIEYTGDVNYGEYYSKMTSRHKKIVVVFDDDKFLKNNLKDTIYEFLVLNSYSSKQIDQHLIFLQEYFDIDEILEKNIKTMNKQEKIFTKIIFNLIKNPDIIALDDLFKYLDTKSKISILNFVNDNNITLINVVTDVNDCMLTDYMYILMKNGKIAIEGKPISVFKEEKLVRRLGFNLPFMLDLSIQLKCYDLIDNIYFSKEEMVNEIWK